MKFPASVLVIFYCCLLFVSCEKITENKPPMVTVGDTRTITLTGRVASDTIVLRGSATDADGSITGYLWSEISGPNAASIQTPGSQHTIVSSLVAGTYIFQLMATDDDGAVGVKTVTIIVNDVIIKELVLRPGPLDGESSIVAIREGPEVHPKQPRNVNQGVANIELSAGAWTYAAEGMGSGLTRAYLRFPAVSTIPSTSEIVSAKLSLYGLAAGSGHTFPEGNSTYPGSPYTPFGANASWLKRVTGNWSGTTITWDNKPGTTDANQVDVPASDKQWGFNVLNLDVTNLVKDMVSTNQNYGFCLQLKNETIYRSLSFSSNKSADSTMRPRLVIVYK
jgi:hypothetical protein